MAGVLGAGLFSGAVHTLSFTILSLGTKYEVQRNNRETEMPVKPTQTIDLIACLTGIYCIMTSEPIIYFPTASGAEHGLLETVLEPELWFQRMTRQLIPGHYRAFVV
jgi:hypothetical protein